jgi:hypothetical protein
MFTKQEFKKVIAEKLKEKSVITRKELINTSRKSIDNNSKFFRTIDSTVDTCLRELVSLGIIVKMEKGTYKKV